MEDKIKKPAHYKIYGLNIESRKILDTLVLEMPTPLACWVWNAGKYLIRAEKKNGLEDYKKAIEYLEWCKTEDDDIYSGMCIYEFEKDLGFDWIDVITGITHNMSSEKALLLDNAFRYLISAEYSYAINCIDKIINLKN